MAITLTATPGDANANSYLTLAEAEAYFETRLHKAAWTAASDEDKKASLIWATRLIDAQIIFTGNAVDATQALAWPRSGMLDFNGFAILEDEIPSQLKYITAELALILINEDRTLESEAAAAGLTRLKAGPVELGFRENFKTSIIPSTLYDLLIFSWYSRKKEPVVWVV